MNRTFTRIAAALAGPAIGVGILAALAAPAQAQAQAPATGAQTQSCVTSTGVGSPKAGAPTMMTRAGQIAASAPVAPSAPSSCVGH